MQDNTNFSNSLFQTYLNSLTMASEEAIESNSGMILNLKNNTFAKYRDQEKRIVQIHTKLPSPNYPCVNKHSLTE